MAPARLPCTRRGLVALAALPLAAPGAEGAPDAPTLFAQDLARSYECQHVALDMEDVHHVFDRIRRGRIGIGIGRGTLGARDAAQAALVATGCEGRSALAVLAFPAHEGRYEAYKVVRQALAAQLHPDSTLIYGGCFDGGLPSGSLRVGLLVG